MFFTLDPDIKILELLLERVCYKTEFEVEGWRKLTPLITIIGKHISKNILAKIQLKMEKITLDISQCSSIKNSWIYHHFKDPSTKSTKIALYMSTFCQISESLLEDDTCINDAGNHCVVVNDIVMFDNRECLLIEDHGTKRQTRYISVDLPFFEEVQFNVNKIIAERRGIEIKIRELNKYGSKLSEIQYGKLSRYKNPLRAFPMSFIRGKCSCYSLKFTV